MEKKQKDKRFRLMLLAGAGISTLILGSIITMLAIQNKNKQKNSTGIIRKMDDETNINFPHIVKNKDGEWFYKVELKNIVQDPKQKIKGIFKNSINTIEVESAYSDEYNLFFNLDDLFNEKDNNFELISLSDNYEIEENSIKIFSAKIIELNQKYNDEDNAMVIKFNADMNNQNLTGVFEEIIYDNNDGTIKKQIISLPGKKNKNENIFTFNVNSRKNGSRFILTGILNSAELTNKIVDYKVLRKFSLEEKTLSNLRIGELNENKIILDYSPEKYNYFRYLINESDASVFLRLKSKKYNEIEQIQFNNENEKLVIDLSDKIHSRNWEIEDIIIEKDGIYKTLFNPKDLSKKLAIISNNNSQIQSINNYSIFRSSQESKINFYFINNFKNIQEDTVLNVKIKNPLINQIDILSAKYDLATNSFIAKIKNTNFLNGEYEILEFQVVEKENSYNVENAKNINQIILNEATNYTIESFNSSIIEENSQQKIKLEFSLSDNPKNNNDNSEFELSYRLNDVDSNSERKASIDLVDNKLIFILDNLELNKQYLIEKINFRNSKINNLAWNSSFLNQDLIFNFPSKPILLTIENPQEDQIIASNQAQFIFSMKDQPNTNFGEKFEILYLDNNQEKMIYGYSLKDYNNKILINFKNLKPATEYKILKIKSLSKNNDSDLEKEFKFENESFKFTTSNN